MDGALTSSANSIVALANGASACDVWWTPTAATTLGANSTFIGTDIDASGIAIGSNVSWTGQALAFGGTVSTDSDTISVASCSAARDDTPAPPIVASASGSDTTTPGLPDTASGASTLHAGAVAAIVLPFVAVLLLAAYLIRKKV